MSSGFNLFIRMFRRGTRDSKNILYIHPFILSSFFKVIDLSDRVSDLRDIDFERILK